MFQTTRRLLTPGLSLCLTTVCLQAQQPCRDIDIRTPGTAPDMIESSLSLVKGEEGQAPLAEWSKVEKLRDFYKAYARKKATCLLMDSGEVGFQLFVSRESLAGQGFDRSSGLIDPESSFQFYGASRLKVERADRAVTRVYAFPVAGPARISEVAKDHQLEVLLEDLAQLQLVTIPRLRREKVTAAISDEEGDTCFLFSQVTLVPSRVFDQDAPGNAVRLAQPVLSLEASRRALEHIGRETRWLQRVEKETPGCRTAMGDGYWARQITSLNLTVQELLPEVDFMSQSIRFWRAIDKRIEQLRAEKEGWEKEIR